MRSMWKTTKSACLEWMVNGKEGLEIKLGKSSLWHCLGFEQNTLNQQGDVMKMLLEQSGCGLSMRALSSTALEDQEGCEMQCDTEDKS